MTGFKDIAMVLMAGWFMIVAGIFLSIIRFLGVLTWTHWEIWRPMVFIWLGVFACAILGEIISWIKKAYKYLKEKYNDR